MTNIVCAAALLFQMLNVSGVIMLGKLTGNVCPARYFCIDYAYFNTCFTLPSRRPPKHSRMTYKAHCIGETDPVATYPLPYRG